MKQVRVKLGIPTYAAGLAALLAAAAYRWGPPGGDAAAHAYLTDLWRLHGWLAWDFLWYSGRYAQVNYSLIYYPLAATLTTTLVIGASAAAAAWAFATLARERWPWAGSWPLWMFAVMSPIPVIAGTYPFCLGFAFGLVSIVMMNRHKALWSILFALLAWASSPLAFAFVALVGAAALITRPSLVREPDARRMIAGFSAIMLMQVISMRVFTTSESAYPFLPSDAIAIAVFCTLGIWAVWRYPRGRDLRSLFLVYAIASIALLATSSPMGGNIVRLTLVAGAPLMMIAVSARRFQPLPLALAAVTTAMLWQLTPPVAGGTVAASSRATKPEYWAPIKQFLRDNPVQGFRVHVVATADNWEAYYLARTGVPLTRGWFRQDDFPVNAPLYQRPLNRRAYRAWLHDVGVRYVMLPDDPLDYTAVAEATMLEQPETVGLVEVAKPEGWTIFAVEEATPIATPADRVRVVEVDTDHMDVEVLEPGVYRLRTRFTPYLRAEGIPGVCLAPRKPWGTTLVAPAAGTVRLTFSVSLPGVTGAIRGRNPQCDKRIP